MLGGFATLEETARREFWEVGGAWRAMPEVLDGSKLLAVDDLTEAVACPGLGFCKGLTWAWGPAPEAAAERKLAPRLMLLHEQRNKQLSD